VFAVLASSIGYESTEKKPTEAEVFVPHARKWGQRIEGTTFVEHKGEIYVEAKFNGKPSNIEYFCDGAPIAKSEVALYLKEANSNAEHQGVSRENEIIIRDFKIRNIVDIKVGGEFFVII